MKHYLPLVWTRWNNVTIYRHSGTCFFAVLVVVVVVAVVVALVVPVLVLFKSDSLIGICKLKWMLR